MSSTRAKQHCLHLVRVRLVTKLAFLMILQFSLKTALTLTAKRDLFDSTLYTELGTVPTRWRQKLSQTAYLLPAYLSFFYLLIFHKHFTRIL